MINNILANYIGKIWTIVSVYIFVPFYINLLGVEAYGIINFYTVLLSILFFADAGLSATLSREFSKSDDIIYCRNLLHSIEGLYLFISICIISIMFLFAGTITDNLLHSDKIAKEEIVILVRLMGIGIAFQFFSTLHNSGLMGLQKQVLANKIQILWSIMRGGLVIVPLLISPNLITFFSWQIITNIIFFFINRYQLWHQIHFHTKRMLDIQLLKNISRFALSMMLMSVVASLNSQLDKLVVSKYLSLKQFSYYSLGGNLSQFTTIMISPLTLAVLPILNKLVYNDSKEELKFIYNQYTFIIAFLGSLIGFTLFFFAKDIALLWTGNPDISDNIQGVTSILALGSVFLSMQYMPYLLAVANGHTKTSLILGIFSIFLLFPLLYFFIKSNGYVGAAYPFLILNIFAFFVLSYIIMFRFMKGEYWRWLIRMVILPFGVNFILIFVIWLITSRLSHPYNFILATPLMGFLCLILGYKMFNKIFPGNQITHNLKNYLN